MANASSVIESDIQPIWKELTYPIQSGNRATGTGARQDFLGRFDITV